MKSHEKVDEQVVSMQFNMSILSYKHEQMLKSSVSDIYPICKNEIGLPIYYRFLTTDYVETLIWT